VGLGLELPAVANVMWHKREVPMRELAGARFRVSWRIASKNGRDSMSPKVPPTLDDGDWSGPRLAS